MPNDGNSSSWELESLNSISNFSCQITLFLIKMRHPYSNHFVHHSGSNNDVGMSDIIAMNRRNTQSSIRCLHFEYVPLIILHMTTAPSNMHQRHFHSNKIDYFTCNSNKLITPPSHRYTPVKSLTLTGSSLILLV
jgi:hypothetical protein